ncbi:geranylgeranyl diphosphate reductase [Rubrimonas cliftonensis]|uniref:Geranylgeranyl reductase n=1 Tax=Rubrimonas cliftonensis TaxID=89524 RepID=A0A1H3VYT6_9RHOB|nr:geranylgeranyl diphosphate reductase [Rubrimonas cliftonensis]SDZ80045.1 geranylgeranyl reductase [Rubrimonas cliftonensis]
MMQEPVSPEIFDVAVIGGGPAGATAAHDLARAGRSVLLLDRAGRIKPCGGAIPPKAIVDFDIPESQLVAKVRRARMISPKGAKVTIPIEGGFVGMVDREHFDEWLRERARLAGAERRAGAFARIERGDDGVAQVVYRPKGDASMGAETRVRARVVIGADGARSNVARQEVPGGDAIPYVIAYHEIVRSPEGRDWDAQQCDVIYDGRISPDFYGWVFPHGATTSVGMGTELDGVSLKQATADLRAASGLSGAETIRREGAPIPLKPLAKWDNGRDVVLAGDASGVVAPASGEGIYYAMLGGRFAADAAHATLTSGDPRKLATARKRFMRLHGGVFWILGQMQKYWYSSDNRRERFVAMCRDKDIQELTFDAYMNKELVKAKPLAHVRIFFKNLGHLTGLAKV